MSKIYGYKEQDVKSLYAFIKENEGTSLTEVFKRFSERSGKSKGTVRNLYYAMAKKSREDDAFRKEFLGGEVFTVKKNEKFDKKEEERVMEGVKTLKEKGYSVRAAVSVLAGGDEKLSLRYQNKYRSALKKDSKIALHGAVALLKKIRPDGEIIYNNFSDGKLISLKNEINGLYDRLFGRIKRENEYLKARVIALEEELLNISGLHHDGAYGYLKTDGKGERIN